MAQIRGCTNHACLAMLLSDMHRAISNPLIFKAAKICVLPEASATSHMMKYRQERPVAARGSAHASRFPTVAFQTRKVRLPGWLGPRAAAAAGGVEAGLEAESCGAASAGNGAAAPSARRCTHAKQRLRARAQLASNAARGPVQMNTETARARAGDDRSRRSSSQRGYYSSSRHGSGGRR
eukprot:6195094-Pleurochrysis_carterae.AAC.1